MHMSKFSTIIFFLLISSMAIVAEEKSMFNAIKKNKIEKVKKLYKKGYNLESKNESGNTALLEAIRYKRKEIAIFLIENGADVKVKTKGGATPLHWAVSLDIDIVKMLLKKGADINAKSKSGQAPFFSVIHKEVLELLVKEYNADLSVVNNQNETLLMELMKSYKSAYHYLYKYPTRDTTNVKVKKILNAYKMRLHNIMETMEYAIDNGVNINAQRADGKNALMIAAHSYLGLYELVKFFLEKGGDVTLTTTSGESVIGKRLASYDGFAEVDSKIVKLLISHGAEIPKKKANVSFYMNDEKWEKILSKINSLNRKPSRFKNYKLFKYVAANDSISSDILLEVINTTNLKLAGLLGKINSLALKNVNKNLGYNSGIYVLLCQSEEHRLINGNLYNVPTLYTLNVFNVTDTSNIGICSQYETVPTFQNGEVSTRFLNTLAGGNNNTLDVNISFFTFIYDFSSDKVISMSKSINKEIFSNFNISTLKKYAPKKLLESTHMIN